MLKFFNYVKVFDSVQKNIQLFRQFFRTVIYLCQVVVHFWTSLFIFLKFFYRIFRVALLFRNHFSQKFRLAFLSIRLSFISFSRFVLPWILLFRLLRFVEHATLISYHVCDSLSTLFLFYFSTCFFSFLVLFAVDFYYNTTAFLLSTNIYIFLIIIIFVKKERKKRNLNGARFFKYWQKRNGERGI